MKKKSTWLLEHQSNTYSQSGEDGVIGAILDLLSETNHWCVEFGAMDGKYLSNTRNLIKNRKYSAVLIEGNKKHFSALQNEYSSNHDIVTVNEYVGFTDSNNLDNILGKTSIPENFDLLSIDIDGNDYHVWKAINKYRPKIVCIEFNPTIPTEVDFVQPSDPQVSQGASLLALITLGKEKNYELVSIIGVNAIFVQSELYPLFQIEDNSINTMRINTDAVTYIFSGYDGTILLSGYKKLPWHQMDINVRKIQRLPSLLRQYPGNYNFMQVLLYGVYLLMHKPKRFIRRFKKYFSSSDNSPND